VAGNVGRVVVGWPDPDTQPAMDPPPDRLPVRVVRALEMFNERTRPVLESGADGAADAERHGTHRSTDRQLAGRRL